MRLHLQFLFTVSKEEDDIEVRKTLAIDRPASFLCPGRRLKPDGNAAKPSIENRRIMIMECHYELKEGCLTISMPRELDHHIAEQLRQEADLLIDSYRVRSLVFDFSGTEFMDSSGIGVLIGRCRNMNYCGGSVKAQHMNGRIQKIFQISGLHKLMEMEGIAYEQSK